MLCDEFLRTKGDHFADTILTNCLLIVLCHCSFALNILDTKLHIINERYEKIVENYLKKAFTMLVNAFLMITMITICYFKTTFLPLMM